MGQRESAFTTIRGKVQFSLFQKNISRNLVHSVRLPFEDDGIKHDDRLTHLLDVVCIYLTVTGIAAKHD